MAGIDHVLLAKETVRDTFVTPSAAYPVISAEPVLGQETIDRRNTGYSRSLMASYHGVRLPTFSIESQLIPEQIFRWLIASGGWTATTVTPAGATDARTTALLANDDILFASLSMQIQQRRLNASKAVNLRGCEVGEFTITTNVGELATLAVSGVAQDMAPVSSTFVDGDSSPALVSSPTYPSILRPFSFENVGVTVGGTPALDGTSKIYSTSGGSALTKIISAELTFTNNHTHEAYLGAITGDRRVPGNREISFSIEVADDDPSLAYFNKWEADTQEYLEIVFTSTQVVEAGFPYKFGLTMPQIAYTNAPFGAALGESGTRSVSIEGKAVLHETTDYDFGMWVQDEITSY